MAKGPVPCPILCFPSCVLLVPVACFRVSLFLFFVFFLLSSYFSFSSSSPLLIIFFAKHQASKLDIETGSQNTSCRVDANGTVYISIEGGPNLASGMV